MTAVISDIHDNLANLKTALDYAKSKNVSALFVLGDITNVQTLKYLANNFSGPIYLVAGNMEVCDLEQESKKYPQIKFLGRHGGVIDIAGHKVGLCHEPSLIDKLINPDVIPAQAGIQAVADSNNHLDPGRSLSRTAIRDRDDGKKLSIVFYGHTHKPFEETRNGVRLINPGNLANVFCAPTFALWDETTNELELKII